MTTVTDHLSTLISQSSSILLELKSNTFSVDELSSKMDKRDETIELLTAQHDEIDKEMISDKDRDTIQSLFDKFERLNSKIDKALKDALRTSRENLASATTKRKADDKYLTQSKPDISKF